MSAHTLVRNPKTSDALEGFLIGRWIDRLSAASLSPTAKLVGFVLSNSADRWGRCHINAAQIMAHSNLGDDTTYGRLQDLSRAGLVRITRGPARTITSIELIEGGAK